MIGVIDYGAGNLQSIANALDRLERPFAVCKQPGQLAEVERIVLPGVGHFGAAGRSLAASGMGDALRAAAGEGKPIFGICLGMQLFLEASDEAPGVPGLGLLRGRNVRLRTARVPHMGWNRVRWEEHDGHYYFAHSYMAAALPGDRIASIELDGVEIPAVIGNGPLLGVQFHPEKSGDLGLALLETFCRC